MNGQSMTQNLDKQRPELAIPSPTSPRSQSPHPALPRAPKCCAIVFLGSRMSTYCLQMPHPGSWGPQLLFPALGCSLPGLPWVFATPLDGNQDRSPDTNADKEKVLLSFVQRNQHREKEKMGSSPREAEVLVLKSLGAGLEGAISRQV